LKERCEKEAGRGIIALLIFANLLSAVGQKEFDLMCNYMNEQRKACSHPGNISFTLLFTIHWLTGHLNTQTHPRAP